MRTRSEYRRQLDAAAVTPWTRTDARVRTVEPADCAVLAVLLLDAYRGTVDDEGEGPAEAEQAIDHYLGILLPAPSVVVVRDDTPVALSFVVRVNGVPYIDPVCTASGDKGRGIGRAAVAQSIAVVAADGANEIGAVVTDGNVPSERLFASLGFTRLGPWG